MVKINSLINPAPPTIPSTMLGDPVQSHTADIAVIFRLSAEEVIKLIGHAAEWVGASGWSYIPIAGPAEPLIVLRNPF